LLEDLETGDLVEVDTSSRARQEFAKKAAAAAARRDTALRRINVDVVEVATNQPYVDALIAFFRARAKRMGRGGRARLWWWSSHSRRPCVRRARRPGVEQTRAKAQREVEAKREVDAKRGAEAQRGAEAPRGRALRSRR